MLTSKKITLKPLLESTEGVHLTAYLVNRGTLVDLKLQLREAIDQADEWLNPVISIEERNKFLEPLDSLLMDARIFKQMKGNIGIFRNSDSFKLVDLILFPEKLKNKEYFGDYTSLKKTRINIKCFKRGSDEK